jgi:MFS family permease
LRTAPFARLLASYTLNSIGDNVGLVAVAILVFDETDDPLATAGLFIAAQFIPAFIAPALTARIDQLALRRILPGLYLFEALIFGVLVLLAENFALWPVLVLVTLDGVAMLTARGLTRGAVNAVMRPVDLLREGNGLINVGFALSSVFGAALGGLIVAAWSPAAALGVDAASFLAIAALLASTQELPPAHGERQPFASRLSAGLRHARQDAATRLLLGGEAIAFVLFTLIVPIEVIYAKETLDAGDAGYGLLLAAWGAGILLGSLLFLLIRQRSALLLILMSTAAVGAAYAGMASVRELWAACICAVVGGLGNGIQWVSVVTALQEITPEDLQARIVGLLESLSSAMTGVGFLLGGIITALTSPPTAFAIAGFGILALTAVGAATASLRDAPVAVRK